MRKCRLIVTRNDQDLVVYQGSQKNHMEAMLGHYTNKGEMARIECDPPQKRRVKINSITGKPKV